MLTFSCEAVPMNRRLNRLWLCAPFLVVALIDAGITLYGQSELYWKGQHSDPNELFSIFAIALYYGPLAYIGVYSVWLTVFSVVIIFLPELLAKGLSLALVNGHTFGTMSWFICDLEIRFELALLFFAFTGLLFVFCDRMWQRTKRI